MNFRFSIYTIAVAFVSIATVPVFAQQEHQEYEGSSSATMRTTPTDSQIAHAFLTINDAEIEAAKLAESKSLDESVRIFASMMIKDHRAAKEEMTSLNDKLIVNSEDNSISRKIRREANDATMALKSLRGQRFDKVYVGQQISAHLHALDLLDNTLIPNAENREVRNLLERTRPIVAAHLAHARQLQQFLNGPNP